MLEWRNRTPFFYVRAIIFTVAIIAGVISWGPPPWLLWSVVGMGVVTVGALLYAWYSRKVPEA
jgi:amino acid transporter